MKHPSKKLDSKYVGSLTITQKVSDHAYRLELPLAMKALHDVFPVKLLQLHVNDKIPHHQQPPPPPVEVDGKVEHEVSAILDSRFHHKKLQYLVEWVSYEGTTEHHTWQPTENLEHAMEYVQDFNQCYPH